MKHSCKKVIQAIALSCIIVVFIASCKKNNNNEPLKHELTEKEKIIEAVRAQYGNITAPVIFQPHKRATKIGHANKNGNIVMRKEGLITEGTCGTYTCATAPDVSDLYVTYTLEYVRWYYTCASGGSPTTTGHSLTAVWKVSAPYNILTGSPWTSNNSIGRFQIKQPNGTVVATSPLIGYINNANGPFIVNEGTDPGCSSNTLFTVSYTWNNISDSYFPGNSVECSMGLYTDCSLSGFDFVDFTQGIPYTGTTNYFSHPCDRVDQAFVIPPSGGGSPYTSIASAYTSCSPFSGFTGTNNQQVEYRQVTPLTNGGSLLWSDQTGSVYGGVYSGTTTEVDQMSAYGDVLFFLNMTASSGTWLVRYRNRHTGCSSTGGIGSVWAGNYVTEIWTP